MHIGVETAVDMVWGIEMTDREQAPHPPCHSIRRPQDDMVLTPSRLTIGENGDHAVLWGKGRINLTA
jgi:hypothetical protein